jgi:XapX domain-containing protein
MQEILSKPEWLSALQSGVLGLTVGVVFSIFGFKPPSPDNLSGIMGIIGIFSGWVLGDYFLK